MFAVQCSGIRKILINCHKTDIKCLTIKDVVLKLVKAWSETSQQNIVSSWAKLPQRPIGKNSKDASIVPDIVHIPQVFHKQTDNHLTEDVT